MTRPLHVAQIATECFPVAKVGGLADVVGALPGALETLGSRVEVVLPDPGDSSPEPIDAVETVRSPRFPFRGRMHSAAVRRLRLPGSEARVFLIGGEGYFPRAGLYADPSTGSAYPDQLERWIFFQRAALALLAQECPGLDVLHCHEHQTALIPFYLDAMDRPAGVLENTATVFTLHNLGYQGVFPSEEWPVIGLDADQFRPGGPLEYYGQINLMKAGIVGADALTVVSPTYAREIQTEEYGCGLGPVIVSRQAELFGILNGIDSTVWNPRTDTRIAARYGPEDPSGKQTNRKRLLERFGFAEEGWPVLAMVSRIDYHKGLDLLLSVLDGLLESEIHFVLLGTGNREIERSIASVVGAHRDRAAACLAFDDGLAHRIIAGADILLMPSRYEPCGLTQMYGLQYGTVPVVRATGGLADTVEEFDPETGRGTGFLFSGYDAADFRAAIDRAVTLWRDRELWRRLMINGMRQDFSWTESARRYLEVFQTALEGKRRR